MPSSPNMDLRIYPQTSLTSYALPLGPHSAPTRTLPLSMATHTKKNITILSWNAYGLPERIDELRHFLLHTSIDILLIQEVRSITIKRIKIPNYTLHLTPRKVDNAPNPYGGTAIYIRRGIPHAAVPCTGLSAIDATCVKIYPSRGFNLTVASVYVRHSRDLSTLKHDLEKIFSLDEAVIAAGDYNAYHTRWNCHSTSAYGEKINTMCIDRGYTIAFPDIPTRFTGTAVIDFAILKGIPYHHETEALDDLSSDHRPILFRFTTPTSLPSVLNPAVVDWNLYTQEVTNSPAPFTEINSKEDVDAAASKLTETLRKAHEAAKSHPPVDCSYNRLPLYIQNMIHLRNYTRKRFQSSRDPALQTKYKSLSSNIRREIRRFKNEKWSSFIESLAPSDNSLWGFLKRTKNPFTPIPPLVTETGTANTDDEKAEAIAAHYETQFTPHRDVFCADTIDEVDDTLNAFHQLIPRTPIEPTTEEEVVLAIQKLPNRKAPGFDGLNNNALKNLPVAYAAIITTLINKIFEFHHFPAVWRHAIVIPIKKPNSDPALPKSFRPISLLPTLGKLVEHIFRKRLDAFINSNDILIPEQFGFRSGHSTTHQLLRVTEYVATSFYNKRHAGAVFLDIAKAFDTVWHSGLIYKLVRTKMPKAFIHFIISYLKNRTFAVRYATSTSSTRPIQAGVPQGSKISPILFEIYINDIPRHPKTSLALFADDTAVLSTSKNITLMTDHLQNHLCILEDWFTRWRIKVNPSKTTALYFSKSPFVVPPRLRLYGEWISFAREAKYLGVILDWRLSWRSHFTYTIQKIHFATNAISSLLFNPHMNTTNKILLYKTVLRPILLYAAPVWGFAAPTNLQKLQTVQNKILRRIHRARWYQRNTFIHSDFRVYPLRHEIKKLATTFYKNLPSVQNELLFNLPDYDPWEFPDRPRASMNIKTGLTSNDDAFRFFT